MRLALCSACQGPVRLPSSRGRQLQWRAVEAPHLNLIPSFSQHTCLSSSLPSLRAVWFSCSSPLDYSRVLDYFPACDSPFHRRWRWVILVCIFGLFFHWFFPPCERFVVSLSNQFFTAPVVCVWLLWTKHCRRVEQEVPPPFTAAPSLLPPTLHQYPCEGR